VLAIVAASLWVATLDASACDRSCDTASRTVVLTGAAPAGAPVISVGAPLAVRPVASGFLGLSIEYYALRSYTGFDPSRVDPVFLQLVRNLDPGQSPVLRLGGDSADWSWIPNAGVPRPPGATVVLWPSVIEMIGAVARDLNARMIFDLDLEADNPRLASVEAQDFIKSVSPSRVEALEIGNEPDLYDVFGWYNKDGSPVLGRPRGYDIADYDRDFDVFARSLPDVALAGPSTGATTWITNLSDFVGHVSHLGLVTIHGYPLKRCSSSSPLPTISQLLVSSSSAGFADSLAQASRVAHAHGLPIRVDELNSIACMGTSGVSDTFASALWALATSLDIAQEGIDGVNFHTLPSSSYALFRVGLAHGDWRGAVEPEYYGLLAFADAAPPGARFLKVTSTPGAPPAWATTTAGGVRHLVLENSTSRSSTVAVRIPGTHPLATLTYLRAAALSSTGGVTINGQSFGRNTLTGRLAGKPTQLAVRARDGTYAVPLPAASAAILTLG
jgi:hypothetical protein